MSSPPAISLPACSITGSSTATLGTSLKLSLENAVASSARAAQLASTAAAASSSAALKAQEAAGCCEASSHCAQESLDAAKVVAELPVGGNSRATAVQSMKDKAGGSIYNARMAKAGTADALKELKDAVAAAEKADEAATDAMVCAEAWVFFLQ